MAALTTLRRRPAVDLRSLQATVLERVRRGPAGKTTPDDVEPAGERPLAYSVLVLASVIAVSVLLQLVVVSAFQQRAAQQRMFDDFRGDLANGVAPIGPTTASGVLLPPGTPVAYLEIPSIGLRQVVGEGTTSATLFRGPGHRRDTPLPGQAGVSLIAGRRAAYGAPFARISDLRKGAVVHVTTGAGAYDYRVLGVRREGEPLPAAGPTGSSRLVLATADGSPYVPSGVVWVDADLAGQATVDPGGRPTFTALPGSEKLLAGDSSTIWALALWLQALLAVLLGSAWAWHRWVRPRAWVVCLPVLVLVSLATAGETAKLLPNLL